MKRHRPKHTGEPPAAPPPPAAPRWGWRAPLAWAAVGAALTSLLVLARRGEVGIWDWDTYQRLQFLGVYRPDLYLDGHVLYHHLARWLMAAGLDAARALVWLTAASAAAFLCLCAWICRREGLPRGATALVLAAATAGSPALVSLFLLVEDNVPYHPVALGVFYLAYRLEGDQRTLLRRGVLLGVLVAVAMLLNVSLLVLLFALVGAALLGWRDRPRALALLAALGAALGAYYLAHVVLFGGAKIALHEFLPQALRFKDFELSTTPRLSAARLAEYLGGLRSVALTPSVQLMHLPAGWRTLLTGVLPLALLALLALQGAWLVRAHRTALRGALRTRLPLLMLIGVALVFPFLYEPSSVERWDLLWIGWLLALVAFLRLRPSRLAVAAVTATIALQAFGSAVVVAHHYGLVFADPALGSMRAAAQEVVARDLDPVVLPFSVNRPLLADFTYRIGGRHVFLVRGREDAVECFRVAYLHEQPVPSQALELLLRDRPRPYVHPEVTPRTRALLGLAPEPARP